jgi:uncharacterized phage protein (TIGR01671 family)
MSRVIKFRAWEHSKKLMIYQAGAISSYERFFRAIPIKPILMQFTGLHDKNGKEIYEGDIIKHDLGLPEWTKYPFYVVFEFGSFQMKIKDNPKTLSFVYHAFSAMENGVINSQDEYESHIEVIGNLHEHPELLKTE